MKKLTFYFFIDRRISIKNRTKKRRTLSTTSPYHKVFSSHNFPEMEKYLDQEEGGAIFYEIMEERVCKGLPHNDSIWTDFNSIEKLRQSQKELKKRIKSNKRRRTHSEKDIQIQPNLFRKQSQRDYFNSIQIFDFERRMYNKHLQNCKACHGIFLSDRILKETSNTSKSVCDSCQKVQNFKFDKELTDVPYWKQLESFYLENEMLPVWYDDKKIAHFERPKELLDLTFTEELLIQIYSPYIPIFCMNGRGHTAYKGHCVCFRQDVQKICNSLPRHRSDVVTVIRKYMEYDEEIVKHFKVRKRKVMNALYWLTKHNRYYKDMIIEENNLSWMNGQVDSIVDKETMFELKERKRKQIESKDSNIPFVSSVQKQQQTDQDDVIREHSLTNNELAPVMNDNDKDFVKRINTKLSDNNENKKLLVPDISEEPVTEYDEDIFPKVFPTLYPGGIGGCNEENKKKYAKKLLSFEDGRFAASKTWSFYALDYHQRDQNDKNGNFFVREGTFGEDYETVEGLEEKINNGNISWIDSVRNYSRRIPGCDNFWRGKKFELETWVRYHISKGHGPPTLFITLSCAENWWPDLKRLLIDRLKNTNHEYLIEKILSEDENVSRRATSKASDLFATIVQTFFQMRVNEWIETIGKKVLGIEFYWGRFEFTKGRGQIHLHMLCICQNRFAHKKYYLKKKLGKIDEADEAIANYAKNILCLTAEHPAYVNGELNLCRICEPEGHANICDSRSASLNKRYHEVVDPKEDLIHLCNSCQIHECNSYCMRNLPKKNDNRYCRAGCGLEENKGECDTPGFPIMNTDKICLDKNRSIKLLRLKREGSRRFVQTSTVTLSSWRANCDVQIIIYDSNPERPNLEEIRRVSDYVVSYTTKVNQTIKEERDMCADIIRSVGSEYSCTKNVRTVVTKMLNAFNGKRIVPRPEVMVLLQDSPLIICSETMEQINISGSSKILNTGNEEENKKKNKNTSILSRYKYRKDHLENSLLEYFHIIKNGDVKKKQIIPFPIGRITTPTRKKTADGNYIVHPEYMKSVLILHRPWNKDDNLDFLIDERIAIREYDRFLRSDNCPDNVMSNHDLALNYDKHVPETISTENDAHEQFDSGPLQVDTAEDILYYNFLNQKPIGFTGSTGIKCDTTIKWWERNCKVSFFLIFITIQIKNSFDKIIKSFLKDHPDVEKNPNLSGAVWLNEMLKEKNNGSILNDFYNHNSMKDDNRYTLKNVKDNEEQQQVVFMILQKIKEYMEFPEQHKKNRLLQFTPLHLTVMGQGGTGKSFIITLVRKILNKIFGNNKELNISLVNAPTGAAAFNASGTTCHRTWCINVRDQKTTKKAALQNVMHKFCHLLFLCIDERSMLQNQTLGKMEENAKLIVHDGNSTKFFGGIPVVLICGDDEQLPTVSRDKNTHGIISFFHERHSVKPYSSSLDFHGENVFFQLAHKVVQLKQLKRVENNDEHFISILQDLRGDGIKTKDATDILKNLNFNKQSFKKQQFLENNAVFLFTTNKQKDEYNQKCLLKLVSDENPALICHPVYRSKSEGGRVCKAHFDKRRPTPQIYCKYERVAIYNHNIDPSSALYNNGLGIIIGFFYAEGKYPHIDLPLFIIVYFPEYNGKPWLEDHPKWVPITPVTNTCNNGCCECEFIPLQTAFARTIHSFQGKEAGPGKDIPAVVVDVGTVKFEATNPGTLYTAMSRASTLGNGNSDESALYIKGSPDISRLTNVKFKRDGRGKYLRVLQKEHYTNFLLSQAENTSKIIKEEISSLTKWAERTKFDKDALEEAINYHKGVDWNVCDVTKPDPVIKEQ